ncbi:MAG: tetratricopeptide repeat protein [Bacteroidota bacterium]
MTKRSTYLVIILLFFFSVYSNKAVANQDASSMKYDSVLYMADTIVDLKNRIDFYTNSWKFMINLDKHKAIEFTKKGIEIAKQIDYNEGYSTLNWQLGLVFQELGKFDSAKYHMNKSIRIAKTNSLFENEAMANFRLGSLYYRIGETDSAYSYYKLVENQSLQIDYPTGLLLVYSGLGKIANRRGSYDEALSYFIMTMELAEELDNSSSASHAFMNIGITYAKMRDYDNSKVSFLSALKIADETNDYDRQLQMFNNLGVLYRKMQVFDSALYFQQKALYMSKQKNSKGSIIRNYINIGTTYAIQKKYSTAVIYYDTANILAANFVNSTIQMSIYQNLSALNRDMGNYNKSILYAKKAVQLIKKTQETQQLASLYENIYSSWKYLKRYDSALYYHELQSIIIDSLFNENKQRNFDEFSVKYQTQNKENELLIFKNKDLEKSILLKEKKLLINSLLGSGTTILIIIILMWIIRRNKYKKDAIIREKEIEQLKKDKEILAAQSLIHGEENERKRIAQELHDGIGVLLSTASIHFSSVNENTKSSEISTIAEKANKLLKMASNEVRKVSHNMMPGVLTKFGLSEALVDLFEDVKDSGKINVEYNIFEGQPRLSENTEIMLYRIVQEMLNNSLKYSKGSLINFTISRESNFARMVFSDNGVGFDYQTKLEENNLGLSGIQSRVDFLHGELTVDTCAGEGCSYSVEIPI